ncbi:hypothetical protein [Streptomyces sp. NPDC046925]|uniref:hypothetical protein n=1 Tax=Streptomyces sp. NPDC046925 TaxID=3155375 RepID=UPI0033D42688
MAVSSAAVTVATSATLLSAADTDSVAGQSIYVTNGDAAAVFLGPSGVTTANGYSLAAGASLPWRVDLGIGEALYAVSAAGTSAGAVKVLRTGV